MDVPLGAVGRKENGLPVLPVGLLQDLVTVTAPWGGACTLLDGAVEKFIHRETQGAYNQMNRDFKYF